MGVGVGVGGGCSYMKQSCDVDVHVHLIVLCHKTFYENLLLNVYRVCNDERLQCATCSEYNYIKPETLERLYMYTNMYMHMCTHGHQSTLNSVNY